MNRVLLVTDGPEDDAGVIAIAKDEPLEVVERFGMTSRLARFGHHEQAKTVAGVENRWRSGVVRGPIRVAARFLQLSQTMLVKRIGHRYADAGMVFVAAETLDFQRFGVDGGPAIGVPFHRANSKGGFISVNDFARDFERAAKRVKIRLIA